MFSRAARAGIAAALLVAAVSSSPAWGEVKVEKVAYANQPNCYRLTNGTVEVIVTTDIGPRILRYALLGGENILAEGLDAKVTTPMGVWMPYGGHRLWVAPESFRLSYGPDSSPIQFEILPNGIKLISPIDEKIGIQKTMTVTLADKGTAVTVLHRLTNYNVSPVDIAPWALTIMNGGGQTILPQEPYISHDDYLLPARTMVLWHYTDLSDPRWTIGKSYLRLRTDEKRTEPQKVGILNKQGWAAYLRGKTLFVKRFPYNPREKYPDLQVNNETYTAGSFMELETVGFMHHLQLDEFAEHTERWYLFDNVEAGETEATLAAAITPLVAQTEPVK